MQTLVIAKDAAVWTITNNDGETISGEFPNWVAAMNAARTIAVETNSTIVRLSARDKRIVEFLRPRVRHARRSLTSAAMGLAFAEVVTPEPTDVQDVIDQIDSNPGSTPEELDTLKTATLVALYNGVAGGKIQGKFKGSRRLLIDRIVAAQAAA